ncbi:hypothetical protein BT93_H0619 [Corymbia citriodora subsp. variegata]|nr:hypothetical protein BT93_H0619 [Corymbia citriodora subsp. variegata]
MKILLEGLYKEGGLMRGENERSPASDDSAHRVPHDLDHLPSISHHPRPQVDRPEPDHRHQYLSSQAHDGLLLLLLLASLNLHPASYPCGSHLGAPTRRAWIPECCRAGPQFRQMVWYLAATWPRTSDSGKWHPFYLTHTVSPQLPFPTNVQVPLRFPSICQIDFT